MTDDDDDVVSMRWYALDADECIECVFAMVAFGCAPGVAEWPGTDSLADGSGVSDKILEMKRLGLIGQDTESRLPESMKKIASEDDYFWSEYSIEEG